MLVYYNWAIQSCSNIKTRLLRCGNIKTRLLPEVVIFKEISGNKIENHEILLQNFYREQAQNKTEDFYEIKILGLISVNLCLVVNFDRPNVHILFKSRTMLSNIQKSQKYINTPINKHLLDVSPLHGKD